MGLVVVFRNRLAVGVGDGDVVEELGATEDEASRARRRCLPRRVLGVVGEDAEDEVVVGFGCGGGAGVAACAFAALWDRWLAFLGDRRGWFRE